jgi:hypothetical protein
MSGAAQAATAAPSAASAQQPEVRIDRLVLDIPGLDPSHARALARGIAEGLAKSGASGAHGAVTVSLAEANGPPADLAVRIVAALMERLA